MGMVFHMKTTLVIDDGVMTRLREEAARRNATLSELVETALRLLLDPEEKGHRRLPNLPSFKSGGMRVDVSSREALYGAMGGRR